jgi:hypothetical protein
MVLLMGETRNCCKIKGKKTFQEKGGVERITPSWIIPKLDVTNELVQT